MKNSTLVLIFYILHVTLCLGQKTSETWKKVSEQFADFELPSKDLRILGSEEKISTDDSLNYKRIFSGSKIDKKLRYKASGERIRCSVMVYLGQTNMDSVRSESKRFLDAYKEPFNSEINNEILKIVKEEITIVDKKVRITLSLKAETQDLIEITTWMGNKGVVIVAVEGLESEIDYFKRNFKLK